MPSKPTKPCLVCARPIEWRKKWERDWDSVKYCSDKCRRAGLRPIDQRLERAILELLASRSPDATICPSEAARVVCAASGEDWRTLMEPARAAARRLVNAGRARVMQAGREVDAATVRGPIRIARGR